MLSRLIGICGRARHGKGEVAAILVELGFTEAQFSSPLKELLLHMDPLIPYEGDQLIPPYPYKRLSEIVEEVGLDEAKTMPEVRRLLQTLGNGAREIVHPDTWVEGFKYRHRDKLLIGEKLVVSDMRYPNEAAIVRDLGGEVWKVVRPDFDNGLGELTANASETSVDDIHPNLTILNDNTLESLRHKVRRYCVQRSFQ